MKTHTNQIIETILLKKKNKKAWLKIVEAFLAVMILLSAVLILSSRQIDVEDSSDQIIETQNKILSIISKNNTLRANVISGIPADKIKVDNAIESMLSPSLDFNTSICDISVVCNSVDLPTDREVYAREVIITSTLDKYKLKKLRLFVWMK